MPADWQDRTEWISPENTASGRYFSYEYDQQGRLFTIATYSKWNGLFQLTDFATLDYDQDGQIIHRNWFDTDCAPRGFVTYYMISGVT